MLFVENLFKGAGPQQNLGAVGDPQSRRCRRRRRARYTRRVLTRYSRKQQLRWIGFHSDNLARSAVESALKILGL
jgi:hypothetical protein